MAQTTVDIPSEQRQSQTTVDRGSSFQYTGHRPLDQEDSNLHQQFDAAPQRTSNRAIAPQNFGDAVLTGFRKGYRSDVTTAAQKTLTAGASAIENILQMAGWIQDMKKRLARKEFSAFVKDLLQWVGAEARKYLDIARAFDGFDLSSLVKLEPFTILKLRTKRYASVVAKLRNVSDITPKLVQDLIKELLPKQSSKKSDSVISGWKQCRSGGGRYYNVLLHKEEVGLLIEEQAQAEGILPQRVIEEAITLLAKQKSAEIAVQLTELVANPSSQTDDVPEYAQTPTDEVEKLAPTEIASVESQQPMDNESAPHKASESVDEVTIVQREIEQYLEEQAAAIAELPEGAVLAGEDETEIQWLLNAPIHKVEAAIREVLVRSAYRALYLLNQFKSSDRKRMDLLEQRVTEYHIAIGAVEPGQESAHEQVIEHSSQTVQATDYSEAEQQYLYQEPAAEDSILLEAADEVSARDIEESLAAQYLKEGNLVEVNATRFNGDKTWNGLRCPPVLEVETKPRPQIIRVGDRVEIVSERQGDALVWQVGVVDVANTVGCVVKVAGQIRWFCNNELMLVEAAAH